MSEEVDSEPDDSPLADGSGQSPGRSNSNIHPIPGNPHVISIPSAETGAIALDKDRGRRYATANAGEGGGASATGESAVSKVVDVLEGLT